MNNILIGEFLIIVGIFGSVALIGIMPVIFKARAQKNPSRWAFKHNTAVVDAPSFIDMANSLTFSQQAQMATTPVAQSYVDVELTNNVPIYNMVNGATHDNKPLVFETSVLDDNTILAASSLCDAEEIPTNIDDELLEHREDVESLVGPVTAALVSETIDTLTNDLMSVIIGYFDKNNLQLRFGQNIINLTSSDVIHQEDNELLLVKGMLLPTGDFRVVHYDAPENVEAGYDVESFYLVNAA